jgi:hypothetical protein
MHIYGHAQAAEQMPASAHTNEDAPTGRPGYLVVNTGC